MVEKKFKCFALWMLDSEVARRSFEAIKGVLLVPLILTYAS